MSSAESGTDPPNCPCCNNPWSRAISRGTTATSTDSWFCVTCSPESKQEEENKTEVEFGLSVTNLDDSVDKTQNFYKWSNGGWMNRNPIPSGYSSWNTFTALHVQSQERCKGLLEELALKQQNATTTAAEDGGISSEEEIKVGVFYAAGMKEEVIEELGTKPLEPILEFVDTIVQAYKDKNTEEYSKRLGQLGSIYGIFPFFRTSASPDNKNSNHTIAQISQGGLGLPDRDYYLDDDKQEKRDAYKRHVAKILGLLWKDNNNNNKDTLQENCEQAATAIFDMELEIAKSHMTRTENRDPHDTYNPMTVDELQTNLVVVAAAAETTTNDASSSALFSFPDYFLGSTTKTSDELGIVNVRNKTAMTITSTVASTVSSETLSYYLQWNVINSYAPYLSNDFVQADFDFYETTLMGTKEIKPRWKRVMAWTESALGEAIGKLYCNRYFDPECKGHAVAIVEEVRKALEARLQEVDWIQADSTRSEALQKMAKFKVKIGYPNEWKDYSSIELLPESDTFVEMVRKTRAFAHSETVKEMNAPTNREKWFMTPQTVNAYYHPNLNEIVFPAAILQHPFFDKNADAAVNFGAMGAVVGHEMTHGFDDKGRKFNHEGVLHDWWTPEDAKEYEARVEVMVEQANQFQVHDKHVQGKLTSGENIADLGGLRLAYRALTSQEGFDDTQLIDGFTPTQRFFLAWAQCWRQNIEKERSLQLVTLDPHGPNEMRCNGPLSNIPEFHKAFDIPSDCPMYKPPELRVDIW